MSGARAKALFVLLSVTAVGLAAGPAEAARKAKKAAGPSPAAMAAKQEREKQAAASLSGTTWSAELTPVSGQKGARPVKDILTFLEGKIASQHLTRDGYPASNFTLTADAGAPVVWETMQTKEGTGVAFWRGEIEGDSMRGVLSKHPTEGANTDYSFRGTLTSRTPPETETAPQPSASPGAASEAPAAVSEQPPAETPAGAEPEKKKGGG